MAHATATDVTDQTATAALRVNSGAEETSLAITKQPVLPLSGIPQPLPPMFGFRFPGTPIFFPIHTPAVPQGCCTGLDGLVYVTAGIGDQGYLYKVSLDGTYTSTSLGTCGPGPICVGPDGNLWIGSTEDAGSHIIRIAPDGSGQTNFAIGGASPSNAGPFSICAGPDGNIWVADISAAVWKITTSGTATKFVTDNGMSGICSGPDGNLWACGGSDVLRVTPEGDITVVGPTLVSCNGGIAQGADGNIWVNDLGGDHVYAVAPDGTTVHTVALESGSHPYTLCAGAGGDIWVTANGTGEFYKITTAGEATSFLLNADARPYWVCSAGDGGLWITDPNFGSGGMWLQPFIMQANGMEFNAGPLKVKGGGVPSLHRIPFAFDTADLQTGAVVYRPNVGDVLINAWFEIDTAWDGTTPLGDVGTLDDGTGWFSIISGHSTRADMTSEDAALGPNSLLASPGNVDLVLAAFSSGTFVRQLPAKITSTDPIKVLVTTDGTTGGSDPGSTQGSAVLFLLLALADPPAAE